MFFFSKKIFWEKNQNVLKIWKLILFCIHFTQNFMLIPNLPLCPGLLRYVGRYRPWRFDQNPKNAVFWARFAMVTVFLDPIDWFWSRLLRAGTKPVILCIYRLVPVGTGFTERSHELLYCLSNYFSIIEYKFGAIFWVIKSGLIEVWEYVWNALNLILNKF